MDSTGRCIGNITPPSRSFIITAADETQLNVTIPPLCFNDGPAGVRLGGTDVTGFPPAINIASTFSRSLMFQRGVAIGEEFMGKGTHAIQAIEVMVLNLGSVGINVYLGPAVDLVSLYFRDSVLSLA